MLRRAEEKDIDKIMELLRQVHRVHSSGRPDLFTPGGIKYKESEVRDIINDEDTPVYVSTDENDVVAETVVKATKPASIRLENTFLNFILHSS